MTIKNARIAGVNVDGDAYHSQKLRRGSKDYVVSQSMLKQFSECPRKWRSGSEKTQTGAMAWGKLVDLLTIGTAEDQGKIAVAPLEYHHIKSRETRPWNWEAAYCREWRKVQAERGFVVVSLEDYEEAQIAASRLKADKVTGEFISCSQHQVMITAVWVDAAAEIEFPVCALLDLVPAKAHKQYGRALGDLKCTEAMSQGGWKKQVFGFGYHIQAAFYLDLYNAATGEKRNQFFHPIVEECPPYIVGRRILSAEFIKMGRDRYLNDLSRYARCLATGHWPDYDETAQYNGWSMVDPESWMEFKEDAAPSANSWLMGDT